MKRLTIIGIILITLFSFNLQFAHAEALNLENAQSCILIDSKTGQVLYEKNAHEKGMYPASTTKILTAIIGIEKGTMDQLMTASEAAVNDIGKDGMNIGIMAGEQIKLENLLEALLITSANETANIIAENISPTREEFVKLMNEKAKELDAVDTHFVNPCGAHNKDHYTTASDMAKIARYGMTLPKFREIVAKKDYQLPATNKHESWPVLYTTNKLLRYGSNELFKYNGIKTGFTVPAGNCLIASAINDEGMELISVVLGTKGPAAGNMVTKYSEQLLEYGFKNYSLQSVVDANQVVGTIPVQDAKNDAQLDLVTKEGYKCVLPQDKSAWNITKKEYFKSTVTAPVDKGDVLGYIEYERNGITLGKVDVVASTAIEANEKIKMIETTQKLVDNSLFKKVILCAAVVLFGFIALRFALRKISRKYKSRRYY